MVKTSSIPTVEAHRVKHPLAREIAKIAISLLILGAGIAFAIFLSTLAKAPPTKESTVLIQQVRTSRTESYAGNLFLEVSGSVVPHREIKVAAEVAGRVVKRYPACEHGMFVQKGEPLLEIDREAYQLELQTLEADVNQAIRRIEENNQQILGEEKSIELSRDDLALQQNELDRNRRLSNAVSQNEIDLSTKAYNATRQQLTTRENNLNMLKASAKRLEAALDYSKKQIEKAKLNLRRTTIKAPADGVIVRAIVQEGDFLTAGATALQFEDTSRAEVLVNLTPIELAWIRDHSSDKDSILLKGQGFGSVYRIPPTEVSIFDPIDPQVSWKGVLSRFDGIGRDDVTKTIPCRIYVDKPIVETDEGQIALVRGMFVKCRMVVHVTGNETQLFSVPEVALHPDNSVWVVTSENLLEQVKVEVVNRVQHEVDGKIQSFVVVQPEPGQIKVGDQVVVTPLSQPFSGMPVLLEGDDTKVAEPNEE
jgi:multidrug efflux pump subunit AcrA (membrane-fusion protein)